jgi:hypothetical protein
MNVCKYCGRDLKNKPYQVCDECERNRSALAEQLSRIDQIKHMPIHPPIYPVPYAYTYLDDRKMWRVTDARGYQVAMCHSEEQAQFIVAACNMHEELVEALEKLQREIYIAAEALARAREI